MNSLFALHSLEHSVRSTEFHREEKREKGDRGDQEQRRGNQRRETNLASDQFPKCSPQPGTPKEIHKVAKKRWREETEVTWGRKGREQSNQ